MGLLKTLRAYGGLVPVAAAFALLLWLPEAAAEGARAGLSLCAGVVVPSLLPFLILSGLAAALGLPALLADKLAPLWRLLRIPPACAAPLLLGLLGGYPVGATALAGLARSGALSPEEAERALPWCNNTGPGFIVGFAGAGVFGSVRAGLLLYLCHMLAALILAFCGGTRRAEAPVSPPFAGGMSLAEALPECVRNASLNMLSICAYVVFFSVLSSFLRAAGVSSPLVSGILELSQGVSALRGKPASPCSAALCSFLLGFGGLSVHCQTVCAVSGAGIKCARHFAGRILHGLISALLAFPLFSMLPQI